MEEAASETKGAAFSVGILSFHAVEEGRNIDGEVTVCFV